MEAPLDAVVRALRKARRVLVTMHEAPDGDAVGSALALGLALREMGKEVLLYNPDEIPKSLCFLQGARTFVSRVPEGASFDAVVCCDAGDQTRLGPGLPKGPERGLLVNLDHHRTTPDFGDLNYIDPDAAAVGVLVFRLLAKLDHRISPPVAEALWVSLVTDTGSFRHSNTDLEAMRIAAELVEIGVKPAEVASRLHDSQPAARLRLLAEVLKSLSLSRDGRRAWVVATKEMFARAGTDQEAAQGFVSFPRSVEGVEVAMLFREKEPNRWRVSFRSRGAVDVSAIALAFGGGGHKAAAGCEVQGTLDEVQRRIFAQVDGGFSALGRPA